MGYRTTRAMDTLPLLYTHILLYTTRSLILSCVLITCFLHFTQTHTHTHFDIHISTFPKPSLKECTCPPFPFRACGKAFPFDTRF